MKTATRSVAGIATLAIAGLLIFSQLGFADLRWPWANPNIARTTMTVEQPEPATITRIEPISLDCRARIHTTVPVVGTREHEVLGRVYRTDTVRMTAVGDIDTCVDGDSVEVVTRDDGSTRVIVPADAIQFVRPRIDAVATAGSVQFDQGALGKITDVFPWVSDNSGLTPAAYAYAQGVVGSSECMRSAYTSTTRAMEDAYRAEMEANGLDPEALQIDIVGEPDFGENAADASHLEGFDFEIGETGASCFLAPDAYAADPSPDDERQ